MSSLPRQSTEYMRGAGADLAKRREAIDALRAALRQFPNESDDPALIRSYMEKVDRDLRDEEGDR